MVAGGNEKKGDCGTLGVSAVLRSVEYGQYCNRLVIRGVDNAVRDIRKVEFPGICYFTGLCALRKRQQLFFRFFNNPQNRFSCYSLALLLDIVLYIYKMLFCLISPGYPQLFAPILLRQFHDL